MVTLNVLLSRDDVTGPLSNIQRNVETAALSLSCNLDLQVHHSRMLWREAVRPAVVITQQLMVREAEDVLRLLSSRRRSDTVEVLIQLVSSSTVTEFRL